MNKTITWDNYFKLLFNLLLAFSTCFHIVLGQDTTGVANPESFRSLFTDASYHIEYKNMDKKTFICQLLVSYITKVKAQKKQVLITLSPYIKQ